MAKVTSGVVATFDPMAPSSEEIALKGCFAQAYNGVVLRDAVQKDLVAHFVGRGEALRDLPLAVDVDDLTTWESEWVAHLRDSGNTSSADGIRLVKWLKARSGSAAGRDTDKNKSLANDIICDLEAIGVVLAPKESAELRARITSREKGELKAQTTGRLPVGILYWGRAMTAEDGEEYDAQFNALGGDGGGTVDITRFDSYIKLHNKTTSRGLLTLERALEKEADWRDYLIRTVDMLEKSGLPKASLQLMKLDMTVTKHSGFSWARKSAYLKYYFFNEFLGIGMPSLMAISSFAATFGAAGPITPVARIVDSSSKSSVTLEDLASASQAGGSSEASSALTQLRSEIDEIRNITTEWMLRLRYFGP